MFSSRFTAILSAFLLTACAEHVEVEPAPAARRAAIQWKKLLERATHGREVDYDLIRRDRETLRRYLGWVAGHGPESDAMRESQEDQRISFGLNAYTAMVIEGVLRNEPLESVDDVAIGLYRWQGGGFFMGQKFRVDGEWVSLWYYKHQYIVDRYQEPLVHVALNSGRLGDPAPRWWPSSRLQGALETAAREWLATDAALRPAGDGWAANEIFFRYEDDFLEWGDAGTICEWMAEYASGERKAWLLEHQEDCPLGRIPYDRSVNTWGG